MSPVLSADPSFATRFMREARIVAVLSHASIVPVFEVGEYDSLYYLSMEYLPAGDLRTRIEDGDLSLTLAIDVCTAVCSALDVAHRKGFVHRDIKPENILFREDDTPVLTDFGIARAVERGRSLTMAGVMVGTPAYMSPEQAQGLEVDGRSDLYAVGVVFYEILTGELPFQAESSLSVALKHVSEPLPRLPPEFAGYQVFIDQLTAKDRDARFATGADVIQALRQITRERTDDLTLLGPRTQPPSEAALRAPTGAPLDTATPIPAKPADRKAADRSARPKLGGAPARSRRKAVSASPKEGKTERPARSARSKAVSRQAAPAAARAPAPPPAPPVRSVAPARRATPPTRRAVSPHSGVGWIAVGALTALVTLAAAMMLLNGGGASPSWWQPLFRAAGMDSQTSPGATPVPAPPSGHGNVPSGGRLGGAPAASAASHKSTAPPAGAATVPRPSSSRPAPEVGEEELRRQRKEQEERLIQQRAAQLDAQVKTARINNLLTSARQYLVTGALWQPPGASAADGYREVLKLAPTTAEAQDGARRLTAVLVEETLRNEAVGDVYTATQLIAQVRSLQATHPKLRELQEKLQHLQTTPAALDASRKSKLERAAIYVGKAHEHLRASPLDARAVDDATGQYDNAMSEEKNAPGLPSLRMQLVAAYPAAVRTELSRHATLRAQKLIAIARKRGWSSAELDRLQAAKPSEKQAGET
jgi:hypothetical protein